MIGQGLDSQTGHLTLLGGGQFNGHVVIAGEGISL